MIEAQIPSDMWSWDGVMVISLMQEGPAVKVEACASIKGQLYDWGKSRRLLERFFDGLSTPRVR